MPSSLMVKETGSRVLGTVSPYPNAEALVKIKMTLLLMATNQIPKGVVLLRPPLFICSIRSGRGAKFPQVITDHWRSQRSVFQQSGFLALLHF